MQSVYRALLVILVSSLPVHSADASSLRLKTGRLVRHTGQVKRMNPMRRHLVVEYESGPSKADLHYLRQQGVQILRLIPGNGVLVSVPDGVGIPCSRRLCFSYFQSEHKISHLIWDRQMADPEHMHAVVEFHPDVSQADARSIVTQEGLRIRHHPDILRVHLLVEGSPNRVLALSQWDEVAYVFPASRALVEGLPVAACHAPVAEEAGLGQYVEAVGDGWDGAGTGSAALTYTYGTFTPDLSETSIRSEMDRAFAEWSNYVEVDFSPAASGTDVRNIHILFGSGDHGDSFPFDGPGGTLAHAFYPSPPNPEPIAGDIHFDDAETWRVGAYVDVFSIGLHELGHSLGLGHADDPNAVMYPYYTAHDGLHSVDIGAIRTLYSARNGAAHPPEAESVSPSSGSGLSQTFRFIYSDADGQEQLGWVFGLVHSTLSPAAGCYFQYVRSQDALWLRTDDGSAWLGPVAPGTGATLSNSQCSVNVAGTTVTSSGNELLLDLPLIFNSSFSGPRNIYLYAADTTGSNSGWQMRGAWNPSLDQPPEAVSVSPSSGSGSTQTFRLTYSDPNGFEQMSWVFGLFQNQLQPGNACFFQYNQGTGTLWLRTDAGIGWLGPAPIGGPFSLDNSQCSIVTSASSVLGSGSILVLDLAVAFQPSFTGSKKVYLYSADTTGRSSGWQQRGTWTPQSSVAPVTVSVLPASGSGSSQTFQFTYADANGYDEMGWVFALFHNQLSPANGCFTQYNPSTSQVWLRSDNGESWLGPVTMGTAATLVNSQCTVNAQSSTAIGNGSNLTLNLDLSFELGFAGAKNVYMYAADFTGLSSGWVSRGAWNPVDASPPEAVSVSPASGSGASNIFRFTYSDENGFEGMGWVFGLFHSQLSGADSCFLQYNHGMNKLWLQNDTGTAWLGPVSLGSVATLQNSQCAVNAVSSSASGSGSTLTLDLDITFHPGFSGLKSIYMYAADTSGLNSTWRHRGTWTP